MDISPKLLREVEFREQWRGYNPEEVDEFLERLALGLEELQSRLIDVSERAATAERRLLDRTDEDEIRRTLVLAQRTATATMDEARAEAERLVQETEARCRQLVADAEDQASRLDAEIDARRREQLGGLADEQARLQADVDELRRFADDQRARVAAALRELESTLTIADAPATSAPVPVPAPVVEDIDDDVEDEPVLVDEPEEPFVIDDGDDEAVDDLAAARAELAAALDRAGVETESGPSVFDDAVDDTGQFDVLTDDAIDGGGDGDDGDAEQPAWRDEHDDDPFLTELRKAVVDTDPLGPRDDDPPPAGGNDFAADGGDDAVSSAGFFRRGRRRS